jgi:serine O-acetyltransferase
MNHTVAHASPAYEQIGGWGVKEIVADLHAARDRWRAAQQRSLEFAVREFPAREALKEIAEALCGALFPMRLGPPDLHQEGENFYVGHTLDKALNALFLQVQLELGYNRRLQCEEKEGVEAHAAEIVQAFARQLPTLRGLLDTDVLAAYQGDPAARSVDEVLLCYPRILAEIAHSATGIDIHPGAQIGEGFFIDHGTGVVIGETTVIGRHVRLYQAVTLGAKRFTQDESGALEKGAPRHPILEDEVVVYAGATILGRITIGRGSSIGGNVWLTRSVPPGSNVSQASLQHDPGGAGRISQ